MPNSPKSMSEPGIRELGVTVQSKKILVLIFIISKFWEKYPMSFYHNFLIYLIVCLITAHRAVLRIKWD